MGRPPWPEFKGIFKMRKPNQNQSPELYLAERRHIKMLWECELLGNNGDFRLLKTHQIHFQSAVQLLVGPLPLGAPRAL